MLNTSRDIKKVLIITPFYPPLNSIAVFRMASFGKYLPKFGWQPIVITKEWGENDVSKEWGENDASVKEPEGILVIRTRCQNRLSFFQRVDSGLKGRAQRRSKWAQSDLRKEVIFWIKEPLAYPDEFIGWKPYAIKAAREILGKEKIDLIFSSALPPTSHIIASELHRETGIPWVAEYRDLWTQNHYARHTWIRKFFDQKLEKNIMASAQILITVSRPWAIKLIELHDKPVEVITNGFDENNYSAPTSLTPYFSITYTGMIYEGKQDPSMLFEAMKELRIAGIIHPEKFKIRFYGPEINAPKVLSMAAQHDVSDMVSHGGFVSYKESILRQAESTVLLLFNWNAPEEKGHYPAKVFEYLGARRPILAVPKISGGVVDELLKQTGCGIAIGTKDETCDVLKSWYIEFIRTGRVSYSGKDDVVRQYTRASQAKKLAAIFDSVYP